MSQQKPTDNRPANSSGGQSKRMNNIAAALIIVSFTVYLVTQWSNGELGNLFGGPSATPTTAAPTDAAQVADNNVDEQEDENAAEENATPVAAATAVEQPTSAPATAASAQATQPPAETSSPSPTANAPPAERASDLPTIAYEDLPPEAHDTIALIESGGPFPYSRDGVTFQNRERILPRQPEGYYREYTVITPGESDRGARRIVTGEDGEMYYTDDHYESFSEIIQ